MKTFKHFVKDYFTFSKKDRVGLVSLVLLILIIYFLPKLFTKDSNSMLIQETALLRQTVDTLQQRSTTKFSERSENSEPETYALEPLKKASFSENATLFTFDPNTLSPEGWKSLGLNDKTAKTINNYITKGGKFYKPEDLQKIWGLPEGFYNRVKEYIKIASTNNNYIHTTSFSPAAAESKTPVRKLINLNTADTSMLIALPGIGSKLSSRIISFRDKLGGFYTVNQVSETYGISDSTFQKIKPYLMANENEVRKINVNTATKDELKGHPYIKWSLANAIVEYRNQHGAFASLDNLKNIVLVTPEVFEKIAPYLTVD